MIEILDKLCEEGTLTSIYSDRDDYDRFSVGYILSLDSDNVLLEHISPNGIFDGFSIVKKEDIYRLENEGLYLEKIKLLNKIKKEKRHNLPIKTDGCLLLNFIDYIVENNIFAKISINADSPDIMGYIVEASNTDIIVIQINYYGKYDGKTFLLIDDIERIEIEDSDCKDMSMLCTFYNSIAKKG